MLRAGGGRHGGGKWTAIRRLALLLALQSPCADAHPLEHTRWVSAGHSACPDVIYFGVERYLFLNACRAPGADGVVERGRYRLAGERITLHDRQAVARQGLDGIPPQLDELRIELMSEDRLVLRAGERLLEFRARGGGPPPTHRIQAARGLGERCGVSTP